MSSRPPDRHKHKKWEKVIDQQFLPLGVFFFNLPPIYSTLSLHQFHLDVYKSIDDHAITFIYIYIYSIEFGFKAFSSSSSSSFLATPFLVGWSMRFFDRDWAKRELKRFSSSLMVWPLIAGPVESVRKILRTATS